MSYLKTVALVLVQFIQFLYKLKYISTTFVSKLLSADQKDSVLSFDCIESNDIF